MSFDFDYWASLAEKSPDVFEAEKKKLLLAEVAKAPPHRQHQLTALVDAVCHPTEGSTLEKAIAAQKAMLGSLLQLQDKCVYLMELRNEQSHLVRDVAQKYSALVVDASPR